MTQDHESDLCVLTQHILSLVYLFKIYFNFRDTHTGSQFHAGVRNPVYERTHSASDDSHGQQRGVELMEIEAVVGVPPPQGEMSIGIPSPLLLPQKHYNNFLFLFAVFSDVHRASGLWEAHPQEMKEVLITFFSKRQLFTQYSIFLLFLKKGYFAA